jgi:trehalose 6-phosphate synthase
MRQEVAMKRSAVTNLVIPSTRWASLAQHPALAVVLGIDGMLPVSSDGLGEPELDRAGVRIVEALAKAGVHVVMASGLERAVVDRLRAQTSDAWWIAEHGTWRHDDAWIAPDVATDELDDLEPALTSFSTTPGVRIERASCALRVLARNVEARVRVELLDTVGLVCDEWLEAHPEYLRTTSELAVEVHRRDVHFGTVASWLRARLPGVRLIAIADDGAYEDLFAALGTDDAAIGIGPAHARTSAADRARLAGPEAVRAFLRWLLDAREGRGAAAPELVVEARPRARTDRRYPLVILSNRTPAVRGGRQREVGGLVSALTPALAKSDGVWLGWSGDEREAPPQLEVDDHAHPPRACFDFPPAWRKHFYGGFCNSALWPLLHGFPSRVRYTDEGWQGYVAANDAYAELATELADPNAAIWAHDYHLLLVGRALRRRRHRGRTGLFLHVPFPGADLFETLPWGPEILDAMLAYDLIGFQTQRWADNFSAAVQKLSARGPNRILPCEIGVFPIGVDAEAFVAAAGAAPHPELNGLAGSLRGRRLLLGVDRLDYAKGIPERLAAFEHLLDRWPEWRGKVSLVQISVPSRAEIPEYAELRQRVENQVGRINGRFGEADWVPVRYLYRSYDPSVLAQLYRMADVALVTPLRDGMNLVAKEFVAAQDSEQPGVLVLSRFAGAADELVDAVLTNPFHPDGLAADLDGALRMSLDERRARHTKLRAAITGRTPAAWADTFLDRLREL